jgi:hypothetical protein
MTAPGKERNVSDSICCFLGCGKPADFRIEGQPEHFEDYTEACEAHLGALMGTPKWREKPDTHWLVYPLNRGEAMTSPVPRRDVRQLAKRIRDLLLRAQRAALAVMPQESHPASIGEARRYASDAAACAGNALSAVQELEALAARGVGIPEPSDNTKALIRDRDELFAKALLATLDTQDVERVLVWFNANRPDQPGGAPG